MYILVANGLLIGKVVDRMESYIFFLTVCFLFIFLYNVVAVHGMKKTYVFFGISELVLIFLFLKLLFIDVGYAVGIFILQFFLVFFIKGYMNNKPRREIYNMLECSKFTVIAFSGMGGLEEEEYYKIQRALKQMINIEVNFEGRVYLFLSYETNKITMRYIFNKKSDYELYVEKRIITVDQIKEMEYIGKGASLVYEYNI